MITAINNQSVKNLKYIFKRGINQNYGKEFLNQVKNPIYGNIPDEMIEVVKKTQPKIKGEVIKTIQQGFAKAANTLSQAYELKLKLFKPSKISDEIREKFFKSYLSLGSFDVAEVDSKLGPLFDFQPSFDKRILDRAAKYVKDSMKAVLPEKSSVNISYMDSGCVGDVYNVSFLDENKNQFFSNRVLKVYAKKFSGIHNQQHRARVALLEGFLKYSDDEISNFAMEQKQLDKYASKYMKNLYVQGQRARIQRLLDSYSKIPSEEVLLPYHGCSAEANDYAYLKNAVGHTLKKTNVVKFDLFDLKNKYSLSPDANNLDRKTIKSKVDFNFFGLKNKDANNIDDNTVNKRIIDLGGLAVEDDRLIDKIVLRYVKKILNRTNEQERLFQLGRYIDMAQDSKTPHREKIAQAVEIVGQKLGLSKTNQ